MSAPHADRDHSEQPPSTATAGSDPTQPGTSRAEAAREVRASEAQQVAAMDALDCGAYQNRRGVVVCVNEHHEHHGTWTERGCPVAAAVADAVVADGPDADEVTRLRAEVERLRGEVEQEIAARDEWEARADQLAYAIAPVEVIGEHSSANDPHANALNVAQELRSRAEAAEAERDRLAEVVARVEALADEQWLDPANYKAPVSPVLKAIQNRLRAALSEPTPAETPQNGPEPALSREQGTSGQSGEGEALRGAEKGEGAGR